VNLLDFLFLRERKTSYQRALQYERSRNANAARSQADVFADAARQLVGKPAIPFGSLPDDTAVRVDQSIALASALVIGATGSGKTRFVLSLIVTLLRRLFQLPDENGQTDAPLDVELELVDPKQETFDIASQFIAALWLLADDPTKERIARAVRVIDWSPDAVSPIAPFDNSSADVSDAYLAFIRNDVAIQASAQTYTESLRQASFMLCRLLVDRRFPPNYRFAVKFFEDASYRERILQDVRDPDVRAYFHDVAHTLPRQTREALLRRIQSDMAFPEVRLSIGIPPADLDRLLPKDVAQVTLGNYGCTMTLPLAKGKERASYRLIDVLLAAPRRNPRRPGLTFIDESVMLLSGSSELAQPLTEGARTLRSVGMGLIFCAQDFANALASPMVRTLMLNTRWWAIFQSREEAEWIYPHAVPSADDLALSEGERHRDFLRRFHGLERQHFYLLSKGSVALPLRALDVPEPAALVHGGTPEQLCEVFRREIASRSMIPSKVAADLITAWEAQIVDQAQPPRADTPKTPRHGTLADLLKQLGSGGE
jgi:hypothetical protein